LENSDDLELMRHLDERVTPLTLLSEIVDDKGFNLLHHAVLKAVPGKVGMLLDLFNQGCRGQDKKYTD
jgi:hypothetical protein